MKKMPIPMPMPVDAYAPEPDAVPKRPQNPNPAFRRIKKPWETDPYRYGMGGPSANVITTDEANAARARGGTAAYMQLYRQRFQGA